MLLAALAVAAGCSTDVSDPSRARAEAYVDVVKAAVGVASFADLDQRSDLVVWIYPLPDAEPIELEVQVEMLELLEEFATVRFVDSFEEAVDDDDGEPAVIEEGVVVGLGAVDEDMPSRIEVERYETEDDEASSTVYVRRQGSWEETDADQ